MGLAQRIYTGTFALNNQQVVKHTPDALVYINGDTSIPGCTTCNGKINLQPFITSVSSDPSTEGPATATVSMSIPRPNGDSLFRDGQFALRPGLEIHIYYRGYFPVQGMVTQTEVAGEDSTLSASLQKSVMYPYYLTFHGVVTDVNYEYSSGEHTATLSCADLLHFWQYQRMSTNGSLFGARPTNSKVRMSLVGHNMTGMTPYGIIYTLFRDVLGSAGGAEFALGNETNADANSSVVGESLFSLSILYWQARFKQTVSHLRMFGMDGTVYNKFQAAYFGSIRSDDVGKLATQFGDNNFQSEENDPVRRGAYATGSDIYSQQAGADASGTGSTAINIGQIQAFVSDIGNWGQVNLFESQYATKLEIANTVKEATGFEFYMDVDGDIVFKPPFYNLDTSQSRPYRIENIDIISFSQAEKEPEATVVKVTGSFFQNTKGMGLEGEWGTRAQFIDYRLVAQFGWRESTFETSYHTNPQAMFFACVARFDLFNINVHSASCTIPLRPELRPGYPVYIVPLDCFYYLTSMSHSFSFGGQCTTSLNLVGKRAKFYPPGTSPGDGSRPTVADVHLDDPSMMPLPLEVYGGGAPNTVPRLQGFPNVVMTIDPLKVNPKVINQSVTDIKTESDINQLIQQALSARNSPIRTDPQDKTKYVISSGNGIDTPLPDAKTLLAQANTLAEGSKPQDDVTKQAAEDETLPLQALISAALSVHDKAFSGASDTAQYLELLNDLKASYNPGASLPGEYRYYSSSHPDPTQQGPQGLDAGSLVTTTTTSTSSSDSSGAASTSTSGTTSTSTAKKGSTIGGSSAYANKTVNSGFGHRVAPKKGASTEHHGIDFHAPEGTPVPALFAGVVEVASANHGGCGTMILLKHDNGVETQYCHNSELLVSVKDKVVAGQIIAKSGSTGIGTGAHIHLEVHQNGKAVDPTAYILSGSTTPSGQTASSTPTPTSTTTTTTTTTVGSAAEITAATATLDAAKDAWKTTGNDTTKAAVVAAQTELTRLQKTTATAPATTVTYTAVAGAENGLFLLDPPVKTKGFDKSSKSNELVDVDVLAGIPIVTATGTKSTPTHMIKTFQVAQFAAVIEKTSTVNQAVDASSFSKQALTTDYKNYMVNAISQTVLSDTTTIATFEPFYNVLAAKITGAKFASPVTAPPTLDFETAAFFTRDETLSDVDGDGNTGKAQSVCRRIAEYLSDVVGGIVQDMADADIEGETIKGIWISLFMDPKNIPVIKIKTKKIVDSATVVNHPVPVFPVSDERGYHVIGSYAYGRGLSIETGGNFEALMNKDRSDLTSYDQVDTYLIEIQKSPPDYAKAIGSLDPGLQAEAATTMDIRLGDDIIKSGTLAGTHFEEAFRARRANTSQSTQKQTVSNAAYSLADLAKWTDLDTCTCRGSDADSLLEAYGNSTFADLSTEQTDTGETVTNWLTQQIAAQATTWAATQQAYRGTVLSTGKLSSVEMISNTVKALPDTLAATGDALSADGQALSDVVSSGGSVHDLTSAQRRGG